MTTDQKVGSSSLSGRVEMKPRTTTVRGFSFTDYQSPLAAALDFLLRLGSAYALPYFLNTKQADDEHD